MSGQSIVVVVGNPQPKSRTLGVASLVAGRLGRWSGIDAEPVVIDLGDVGPGLLVWGDPGVAELTATVKAAGALVVASPTYKASFTGLLKIFLDQFDKDVLGGVPTVAIMTGGNLAHTLAVEMHLKPVLSEIGASLPTAGLFVAGPQIDDPEPLLDSWSVLAEPILRRTFGTASVA